MKLLISTLLLAGAMSAPAFAGVLDGQPADPEKRARSGGYNEAVANLKSMASCVATRAIKDEYGNIIDYRCP